ncbi:hypothetical protein JDV02_000919 [Purpureocillium takamizusanense]|uniref:Cysteine-rich PDZ-binding protein n=1 Tax=Purpureocillium takamizusanense TaxID=2060973 RepID=A0A9Q8Q5S1_9HYPO|nr:uncharacterized protein JDV02_000919 [Purpureocillium takamizusanense]UNI14274.1 hypothetical protein JDV02_000919 [Purpureocillium takamizusanense]
MVCAKCQKLGKGTTLATPEVKKKSEMYYGSPASSSKSTGASKSTTVGQSGIVKSKLLSKSAKNPYAQYSSSCSKCKTKITQGHTFCHTCAYKNEGMAALVSLSLSDYHLLQNQLVPCAANPTKRAHQRPQRCLAKSLRSSNVRYSPSQPLAPRDGSSSGSGGCLHRVLPNHGILPRPPTALI